jgi:hypothetical protein
MMSSDACAAAKELLPDRQLPIVVANLLARLCNRERPGGWLVAAAPPSMVLLA